MNEVCIFTLPPDCAEYQATRDKNAENEDKIFTYEECSKYCRGCRGSDWRPIACVYDNKYGTSFHKDKECYPFVRECADRIVDALKGTGDTNFPDEVLEILNQAFLLPTDETGVTDPNGISFKDGYDHCLKMKRSWHDCVAGCCSGFPHDSGNHRNSHQFCIAKVVVAEVETFLSCNGDRLKDLQSFDELFAAFVDEKDRAKERYSGLGLLAIYDTALRVARQSVHWERLKPDTVYLHAGVLWGAEALRQISKITGLKWFEGTSDDKKSNCMMHEGPRLLSCFNAKLTAKIEVYLVENELCVYHWFLYLLEFALRLRFDIKLRITKHAKKAGVENLKNNLKPTAQTSKN